MTVNLLHPGETPRGWRKSTLFPIQNDMAIRATPWLEARPAHGVHIVIRSALLCVRIRVRDCVGSVAVHDTAGANRLVAVNTNSTHVLECCVGRVAESMSFDVRSLTPRVLLWRRGCSGRRCNRRWLRRLVTSKHVRRTPSEKRLHRLATEVERRHPIARGEN